ncbi:MAG: signal peptidase II [Elusimicrobiaceae bacterium]|nr:signal peptidase II [Elusimicrobiaceae bacterium]
MICDFLLRSKKYKFEIIVFVAILLLDRVTKIFTLKFLLPKGSIDILPFFSLTYVENTGSAFGLFQNANLFLLIVSLLVLFLMIKWRKDILSLGSLAKYGYLMIFAGALGNIYDRIVLGHVVDFLDFHFWPVFNIADSAICVGATFIAFDILKAKKKEIKK